MADIVLQDGTGESQTYENVETLEVDTPDGGTATFVSEDLIPEAYVHPSTHPASMITGLAAVAKGGEFADLRAKPFGDMPRLEECELSFPASEDGYSSVMIPGIWDVKPGDAYVITYDGTQYPCVCKSFADTEADGTLFDNLLYLGNAGMIVDVFPDVEDTGEPFMFWFINNYSDHAADVEGNTEVRFTIQGAAETHTISIIPTEDIRKLDAKYLPDEAATKEFVEEAIAGIEVSGGSAVTETDIFPEQTVSGFAYNEDTQAYSTEYVKPAQFELVSGETYNVMFDGEEYSVVAGSVEYSGMPIVYLGDATSMGASGNGEPFLVTYNSKDLIGGTGTQFFTSSEEESHIIRIYQKAKSTTSALPEFDLTAMGLPTVPSNGSAVSVECDTTELRAALDKGVVKFNCVLDFGTEIPASFLATSFYGMGTYQANGLAYFTSPLFACVIVKENSITAMIIELSTASTTTT